MNEVLLGKVFSSLTRGVREGRSKPYRPSFWVSILNLLDQGDIPENKISYDPEFTRRFKKIIADYASGNRLLQSDSTYFHLRSSDVWQHKIRPSEEVHCATPINSDRRSKYIKQSKEYVFYEQEVYSALSSEKNQRHLRAALDRLLKDKQGVHW